MFACTKRTMSWVEVPGPKSSLTPIFFPRSWPSSPGLATTTRTVRTLIDSPRAPPAGPSIRSQRGADLFSCRGDLAPVARHELPVEAPAVVGPARDHVEMEVGHGLE